MSESIDKMLSDVNIVSNYREKFDLFIKIAKYYEKYSLDQSINYYLKAFRISREKEQEKDLALCYYSIASLYDDKGLYDKALPNIFKAITIYTSLGNLADLLSDSYNVAALIFKHKKNYRDALKYYYKALEIKEKIHDNKGRSRILLNLGVCYYSMKQEKSAIESYKNALVVLKDTKDPELISACATNLALIYFNNNEHSKSLKFNKLALSAVLKIDNPMIMADIYLNLGLNYQNMRQVFEAQSSFKKALKTYRKLNSKQRIGLACYHLGKLLIIENIDHELGRNFVNESYSIFQELQDYGMLSRLYEVFSRYYQDKGDYESVSIYLRKELDSQEKYYNSILEKRILEIQTHYAIDKANKEKENYQQQNENLVNYKQEAIASWQKLENKVYQDRILLSIINNDICNFAEIINNILTLLVKKYEFLEKENIEEKLHVVADNSGKMISILRKILKWSISSQKRFLANFSRIDIIDIVDDNLKIINEFPFNREITYQIENDLKENIYVWSDKEMLSIALRNIFQFIVCNLQKSTSVDIKISEKGKFIFIEIIGNVAVVNINGILSMLNLDSYNLDVINQNNSQSRLFLCKYFINVVGGKIDVEASSISITKIILSIPVAKDNVK